MTSELRENFLYKKLVDKKSDFIVKIDNLYSVVNNLLPQVNRVFDNYTEHGIGHSMRVLSYMEQLINDVNLLSDLEITMIIYSALLHDIGMVVNDDDIEKLKKEDVNELGMRYSIILKEYGNDKVALQECFRPVHGLRSVQFIKSFSDKSLFCIPGTENISFADEVADICASHNESVDWIKNSLSRRIVKGDYSANPQFISLLLRLGDILDIDESRTPPYLYSMFNLSRNSDMEWKQHYVIENTKKIFIDEKTNQKFIVFHGKSTEAEVHRKILKYIDWVNVELENSINMSSEFFDKKYLLFLKEKVVNKIETKGFSISDFKLSLDYKAVTGLLMGEKIYGDKKYGLRELIQNSIDACKLMKEIHDPIQKRTGEEYSPYISIILDKAAGKVRVRDNGIGMTFDVLRKFFLNVGVSYYSSNDFRFKGYEYKPIGNYGIGFLACFMLSDNVIVKTKHYSENQVSEVSIEKSSEFISLTYHQDQQQHGTEVTMNYDSFMKVFNSDVQRVQSFIEENFLMDDIKIKLLVIEEGSSNQFDCNSKPVIDERAVCIDEYLNGIETNIVLKEYGQEVITLDDLIDNQSNEIFIYDSQGNRLYKAGDIEVSKLISEDVISYLKIPIIDESISDRFYNLIDALGDWEEAYEKISGEISEEIFIFSYDWSSLIFTEGKVDKADYILGDYKYEMFCEEFNSNKNCGTNIEQIERIVSHKDGISAVVPVKTNLQVGTKYYSYQLSLFNNNGDKIKQKIYNKNVYLSNMSIILPYLAEIIKIDGATINLRHKDVIPSLARDNITDHTLLSDIAYAIGRAIHMHFYKRVNMSKEQKELFKVLLDTYYSELNQFCR